MRSNKDSQGMFKIELEFKQEKISGIDECVFEIINVCCECQLNHNTSLKECPSGKDYRLTGRFTYCEKDWAAIYKTRLLTISNRTQKDLFLENITLKPNLKLAILRI